MIPELLPYIVHTDGFYHKAVGTSAGSLSPRTKFKELAKYQFDLPADPVEQLRIAKVFAQTDDAQEQYREAVTAMEALEEAFVSEEVLGSDQASLPGVPIGDDAEIAYGLTVNADRRELPNELPYLRVANVQRNALDLEDVKMIGATEEDETTFDLQDSDLLVVEGHADPTEIGRAAIWRHQIEPCLHQNHILRIRCGKSWVPEFVLVYLNSREGRKYFRRHAKSTSGLYTINSSVLRNICLPPLDTKRQGALVEKYQAIELRKAEAADHIAQLVQMKKRLLRHLLTPPAEGS